MPGPRCNVKLCNNFCGTLTDEGEKITFHRFPKKPELRKIWLEKCQKVGNWNVNYGYVCSEHFQKEDFKRNLQAELLGYKGRRKLKPFAVPSQNLPKSNKITQKIQFEEELQQGKGAKERLGELIDEYLLTSREEIPPSYEVFKKWYKNHRKNKKNHSEVSSSPELVSIEISKDKNEQTTKALSENKLVKQKLVRRHLKRNLYMQKKMMEKIFLATYFHEPFSEENSNRIDEDFVEEAKSALLKVFALAPNSYNKYAKQLNLPCKDVLLTWSNQSHQSNE